VDQSAGIAVYSYRAARDMRPPCGKAARGIGLAGASGDASLTWRRVPTPREEPPPPAAGPSSLAFLALEWQSSADNRRPRVTCRRGALISAPDNEAGDVLQTARRHVRAPVKTFRGEPRFRTYGAACQIMGIARAPHPLLGEAPLAESGREPHRRARGGLPPPRPRARHPAH
jgi:hypothetical protein